MKSKRLLSLMMLCFACFGVAKAQTSLFSEDFEGGSMPSGWTQEGNNTWSVATTVNSTHPNSAGHGTYCAQIKHGTTGNATKLITPAIDLSSVASAELTLMRVNQSWAGDTDELRVYYRNSASGSWTLLGEFTDPQSSWVTESDIALPNLSSTYQIAFEYTDRYGYGLGIDYVNIIPGASCPKPAGLAVAANGQSATLTWAGDASQFAVAHSTDANANPSDNVVTTVSSTTYTMDNLAIDTDHYFWVRANCSATEQSGWAGPISAHIGYCLPNPTSHDGSGITGVSFGMGDYVVENGGEGTSIPASAPYYGDYSNMIGAVQAGVASTIAITTSTGSYPYTFVIWVDFDNSLSFEDSEVVYVGKASTGAGTLNATITVPATQATGDYRMRIYGADSYFSSFYGNGTTNWEADHDPCSSGTYRHANDYTLRVLEAPSCLMPTGLAVTTDGSTATATWEGTATSYNIDINGTVTNNVTSPYEFNVELSTTYAVKVQANCDGGETSDWTEAFSFTTPECIGGRTINYTLNDSYGDGWNGNAIQVIEGCGDIIETLTLESGYSASGTLTLCGNQYQFVWVNGLYAGETSFTFTENGTTLFTKPSNVSDGLVLYTIGTYLPIPTGLTAGTPGNNSVELSWTAGGTETAWQLCVNGDENNLIYVETRPSYTLNSLTPDTDYTVKVRAYIDATTQSCWTDEITVHTAEACAKPTNLAEANISFTTADLSWQGTSDSYVLQYRPWNPAGDDIITTSTMTTYTVDLSQYEGTGSVAIRHYDISDMFQLIVDNIEVTNAAGTVVYSQDFEDCNGNMPAEFSNMDLDGDGFTWQIASSPSSNVDGSYGIVSESYNNDYGALTPDNWLILSGLEMGGQMTFQARGQDPQYAAENFAIYVSTESSVVEIPVSATTIGLTDLTPNTPYAWQVKGICGEDESGYASSFFKTLNDTWTFVVDGNWNDAANWLDHEGNTTTVLPSAENNVRIDADAVIPTGYVAYANKATIGTGSITIKDGGQLKQNAATLRVTMEKEIDGYGTSDGNYYFIASPFNGRTLYTTSGSFSHVDNMLTGDYDLYAFDATATDGLEWINYKSEPTHIAFQAENGLAGLLYGEGYLYANKAGTTIEFEGTAGKSNNYSETKDYTFDGESSDEWNGWALVGNFFTCNAYINYVDANGNVLDADFYTLNLDNTYSLMSSNQPLAPCTGALINYSATGKVQYSTEPTNSKGSMLNMTVSEGRSTVDQVRVRFGQGHNLKHMSFRNSSKLYMPVEGNDFAVVYAENEGEMPVNFKAEKNGTYTLSFNTENVEFGYLHLIDNMTGADVDLLSTPSYSFEASVTDYASRFRLVFATGNDEDSFAFFSNGSLFVNNEGNATVQVVDVTGRIIMSESINGSASVNFDAAPGVYMVRLVNGDNMKVQKVVK